MKKKPNIDWHGIEHDYCKSNMSGRQIAEWYNVSEGLVRRMAKSKGWVRENYKFEPTSENTKVEREAVKVAKVLKPIVETPLTKKHLKPEAISERGRELVVRMLDELDASTTNMGELEQMIHGVDNDVRQQAMMQALSLKQRADVIKTLALAAKTLADAGINSSATGKKEERQKEAEELAAKGSKFAVPEAPRLNS